MAQVRGRRVDGRDVRDFTWSTPRQDRCLPARASVRQPGFRACDEPRRVLRPAPARDIADDLRGRWIPGQSKAACRKVDVAGDVEKRWQQRPMPGLARVEELRDLLHVDGRAGLRGRVRPRERAVRGAEIDADNEARSHRIGPIRKLRLPRAPRRCGPRMAEAARPHGSLPIRDDGGRPESPQIPSRCRRP